SGLIKSYCISKVTRVVPGGKERQDSVYCGIKALDEAASIVVVHDGARPFADRSMVRGVIDGLRDCDGAVAGVRVKDTIKETGGQGAGVVVKTLERSALWSVQTPQVFRARTILEAHEKARSEGYYATDDAALVERYGGRIRIVEGSYRNIKVTTPDDIYIAEAILKGMH
ncbi:MAG TPA: 2-C-methyl-D-erythritol 4-phosphate cytidylyltransferase, partial [Dissulfurispiraceae bacterium]